MNVNSPQLPSRRGGRPIPQPHDYRPDFYTPENIIGHTGSLHSNPTVYFRRGQEFGRITQSHQYAWNLGRQEVRRESRGKRYVIGNRKVNGAERAEEKFVSPKGAEELIHVSRSPFISCKRANVDQLAILASAIRKFPNKKVGPPITFRRVAHHRTYLWGLGVGVRAVVRTVFR